MRTITDKARARLAKIAAHTDPARNSNEYERANAEAALARAAARLGGTEKRIPLSFDVPPPSNAMLRAERAAAARRKRGKFTAHELMDAIRKGVAESGLTADEWVDREIALEDAKGFKFNLDLDLDLS